MIPLDRIIEDPSLQVRVRLSESTIKDYEEIVIQSGHMDPITVWRTPEGYETPDKAKSYFIVSSGHNRAAAYRNLGKAVIPAVIRDGSMSEMLEDAIVSNSRHGQPLTNSDKRRACELAVKDTVMGQRKDSWIAKVLGVSTGFVNGVRRGLTPEDKKKRAEARKPKDDKPNAESPAPKGATARERKNTEEEKRPTAKGLLHQIDEWVNKDMVDEEAIIRLFDSADGQYRWMKKDGKRQKVTVINKSGEVLAEFDATIKSVSEDSIVVSASIKDIVAPPAQ